MFEVIISVVFVWAFATYYFQMKELREDLNRLQHRILDLEPRDEDGFLGIKPWVGSPDNVVAIKGKKAVAKKTVKKEAPRGRRTANR